MEGGEVVPFELQLRLRLFPLRVQCPLRYCQGETVIVGVDATAALMGIVYCGRMDIWLDGITFSTRFTTTVNFVHQ